MSSNPIYAAATKHDVPLEIAYCFAQAMKEAFIARFRGEPVPKLTHWGREAMFWVMSRHDMGDFAKEITSHVGDFLIVQGVINASFIRQQQFPRVSGDGQPSSN